jgi:hypothetical protein
MTFMAVTMMGMSKGGQTNNVHKETESADQQQLVQSA